MAEPLSELRQALVPTETAPQALPVIDWRPLQYALDDITDAIWRVFQDVGEALQGVFSRPATQKRADGIRRHAALQRARAWEQVPPNATRQRARSAAIERQRSGARWQKTTGDRERELARLQAKRRASHART